jgi:hypothetical protein
MIVVRRLLKFVVVPVGVQEVEPLISKLLPQVRPPCRFVNARAGETARVGTSRVAAAARLIRIFRNFFVIDITFLNPCLHL